MGDTSGPFKLKSGNSPLFKMVGSSPCKDCVTPLQHRKKDIHGKRMKHQHRGGGQSKTRVGRFLQRLFGRKEKKWSRDVMR